MRLCFLLASELAQGVTRCTAQCTEDPGMKPIRHLRRRTAHRRRGAACVEFAVLLPLLLFSALILVDYSRSFFYSLIVDYCARDAALYAGSGPTQSKDLIGIKNAATSDGVDLGSGLTVQSPPIYSTDAKGNNYVTVTCTYTFKTYANYPGIPSSVPLTRSATTRIAKQ